MRGHIRPSHARPRLWKWALEILPCQHVSKLYSLVLEPNHSSSKQRTNRIGHLDTEGVVCVPVKHWSACIQHQNQRALEESVANVLKTKVKRNPRIQCPRRLAILALSPEIGCSVILMSHEITFNICLCVSAR